MLFILYHVAQDCPHGVPAHVSSSKDAFQMTPWLANHTDYSNFQQDEWSLSFTWTATVTNLLVSRLQFQRVD